MELHRGKRGGRGDLEKAGGESQKGKEKKGGERERGSNGKGGRNNLEEKGGGI